MRGMEFVPHGTSQVRYERKWHLGDPGAVYEFNIKLPKIEGVRQDLDWETIQIHAEDAIEELATLLRRRFFWVGEVYQTGRSRGWLAVEDKTGRATEAGLQKIAGLVDASRRQFIRMLREEYPA